MCNPVMTRLNAGLWGQRIGKAGSQVADNCGKTRGRSGNDYIVASDKKSFSSDKYLEL
jgi:hypothetical protein